MMKNRIKKLEVFFLICILICSEIPYVFTSANQTYLQQNTMAANTGGDAGTTSTESIISLKGDGTEKSPYMITNADELKGVLDAIDSATSRGKYNSAYYKMANDISMKDKIIHEKVGNVEFSGLFDGNGYTISELDTTALFPRVSWARIQNLTIADSKFSLAAISYSEKLNKTKIKNCCLKSTVVINADISKECEAVGGIASYAECEDCVSEATCNFNLNLPIDKCERLSIGAIVGKTYWMIKNCHFSGELNVLGTYRGMDVGGIVGYSDDYVSKCSNSGKINVEVISKGANSKLGGIVGDGIAFLCNNTGDINCTNPEMDLGGIVGMGRTILCSNSGKISGLRSVGGLAAYSKGIYSSYNVGDVTGGERIGGLAGTTCIESEIYNSYTCGKVNKISSASNINIGVAIGYSADIVCEKVFYLKQESMAGVGNLQKISGLEEKTEDELKSNEIATLLSNVSKYYGDFQYMHNWKVGTENNGYPTIVVDMIIYNDIEMRDIAIESDKKIYYAYLPLKKKAYILKSKDVKEADYYEGRYHIDYSCIKTSKAAAIGISTEIKDFNVQGFEYEQGRRKIVVSSYEPENLDGSESKSTAKMRTEKTEKVYHCLGSEFKYVIQIAEYPSKYTSKTSGIKFNYNWENDNRCGMGLLDAITKSYYGLRMYSTSSGTRYKLARKTYRLLYPLEDSEIYFIWRKKGETRWRPQEELTFTTLKEYGIQGDTIQLRFNEECYVFANKTEYPYEYDEENSIEGNFFGNIINVKIPKLKKKSAPKIKVDVEKMTINVKNGMQISFNQKEWYTIFPYSKKGDGISFGFDEYCIYENADNHYTSCKVSSLSLLDETIQKYMGKDIYVRNLGKNSFPSEIATVHLPDSMCDAPRINIVDMDGRLILQDITRGANDKVAKAEYEYCVGEDSKYIDNIADLYAMGREYSYSVLYKWKTIKLGTEVNNKLSTKYTYKLFFYKEISNGDDETVVKVNKKTVGKTVYLFGKRGEESPVLDIYVRRKGDKASGIIPSKSAHYRYNTSQNKFEFVSDEIKE